MKKLLLPTLLLTMPSLGPGASCESLRSLSLPDTTITTATVIAPGAFPAPPSGPNPFANLPAFCRVAGTIRPTSDSDIRFETWMPLERWNGRFQGIGNLGISGEIPYAYPFFSMATSLAGGYATGGTDSGHTAPIFGNADWALGHPEKVIDYAHRGIHVMTVASKALVFAFYETPVKYSYFTGCSNGGAQGLAEAQRYPLDYNGVLAVAPANYLSELLSKDFWQMRSVRDDPASRISQNLLAEVSRAVLRACDAADGVTDGVLEDPRRCRFDLATLRCGQAETSTCLNDAQIAGLRKIYEGPVNPETGEKIYPGPVLGSELAWSGWVPVNDTPDILLARTMYPMMIFDNPTGVRLLSTLTVTALSRGQN